MKLIVGLGNPGEKYQNNRHNVGFLFIDYIATLLHCSIVKNKKLNNVTIKQCNNDIYLAKPQTFMNRSGQAVKKIVDSYQLAVGSDLVVVHDDLDIPLGKFKIQTGTGPQLHNGIDSINANLKTHDYLRIRIGVDNRPPENRINGEAYVLQDFTKEEIVIITQQVFTKILPQLTLNKLMT